MDRITQLRSMIFKAKQCYYFGGNPIMTDAEYDALEDELRELDPGNPILAMTGCPIPPDGILEKVQHQMHMGSQDKVNTEDEFRKWYAKNAQGRKLHVSLKGDGMSAAAYYEEGSLIQGISRGDGITGEDITASMIKFKGIPSHIENTFEGSVRFEAILTKEDWGITGGKNPRNQGSGIIGRKNGTESEYITAYAFDIVGLNVVTGEPMQFATETEKSLFLQNVGVNPMPWKTVDSADEAVEYYKHMMKARGEGNNGQLPFWIDGVVIKIDDLAVQEELGLSPSGKYHKGQVAWKPDEEGATTVLRSIVITGGHTGNIIPNARFDPVEIGGTTVCKAILNNWEEIARLGVAIGDTIFVVKANEIIPKIRRVVDRPKDREEFPEPTACPFCGGEVGRNETKDGPGAITMCLDPTCPVKQDKKLKSWINKTDILQIGDSARMAMREQLGIYTAADLYKLGLGIGVDEFSEIIISGNSRLGRKAEVIIEEINKKRDLPLHIFLGSLGINALGRREVQIACEKAPGILDTLADWRSGRLRDPNIAASINAPTKAEKWADSIDDMADIIDGLLAIGVVCRDAVAEVIEPVGDGGKVCITGTLPSGKKKAEYADALAAAGFTLVDKVSKDLAFLVVANPSIESGKSKKAAGYNAKGANIQVVDEAKLIELIGA